MKTINLILDLIIKGCKSFYSNHLIASKILTGAVIVWDLIGIIESLVKNRTDQIPTILVSTIFLLCLFFILYGFIRSIIELPFRLKQDKYYKLFGSMNFKSVSGECPIFINEKETDYLTILTFRTRIPIEEWNRKKNVIEMYMNANILKFRNPNDDNNIIQVLMIKQDLPNQILWNDELYTNRDYNKLNLGVSHEGIVSLDLNKYPHSFLTGTTGNGKSNLMKGMIYQSIKKGHDVILIDFKRGVSFSVFSDIVESCYDLESTKKVFSDLVNTTNSRLDLLRENGVEGINIIIDCLVSKTN